MHVGRTCKEGGDQHGEGEEPRWKVAAGKVQSWPDPLGSVGVIPPQSCYVSQMSWGQPFAPPCQHSLQAALGRMKPTGEAPEGLSLEEGVAEKS